MSKLYIVHDPRYGSMVRPMNGRDNHPEDTRWMMPRFLERLDLEMELVEVNRNPPVDAKVVWFALPDPSPWWTSQHYENWAKKTNAILINPPQFTYRTKELWYYHMNSYGIRAPQPYPHNNWFTKSQYHGMGAKFGCEFIYSVPQNHTGENTERVNSSQWYKIWRLVYFDGHVGEQCARMEGTSYLLQSGGADKVREMYPTPKEYKDICHKVAEMSGLKYFHIEIIPSPWAGPVVCDVNQHPFDVMDGKLNDVIQKHVEDKIKGWLDE